MGGASTASTYGVPVTNKTDRHPDTAPQTIMWLFCGSGAQESARDMKKQIQEGLAFLKERTTDAHEKLDKEGDELRAYEDQARDAITAQEYTTARIYAERYLLKQRQVDRWVLTIKRYDASKAKLEDLWHTKVEEQTFIRLGRFFKGIQKVTSDAEDRDLEAAEDEHIDFDEFTRDIKERVQDSVQHATMGDDVDEDEVERQLRAWGYDAEGAEPVVVPAFVVRPKAARVERVEPAPAPPAVEAPPGPPRVMAPSEPPQVEAYASLSAAYDQLDDSDTDSSEPESQALLGELGLE